MDENRPADLELGVSTRDKVVDLKNPFTRTLERLKGGESFRWVEPNRDRLHRHLNLSADIAKSVLGGKLSVDQAADRLSKDRSIRHYYPELAISPQFLKLRPNIVFTGLSISKYEPAPELADPDQMYSPYGDFFVNLKELGIDSERIMGISGLKETLTRVLTLKTNPNIKELDLETVIKRLIYEVYLGNLELYRLAKDTQGTVMRFVSDKELNDSVTIDNFAPWSSTLPDELNKKAFKNYVSFWFREDARYRKKYLGKKQAVVKVLSELEQNNLIALDEEENALATVRIRISDVI